MQGACMSDERRRNGAESCWEAFRWWIYCAYFKVDLLIQVFIQFHCKDLSNTVSLKICMPAVLDNDFTRKKSQIKSWRSQYILFNAKWEWDRDFLREKVFQQKKILLSIVSGHTTHFCNFFSKWDLLVIVCPHEYIKGINHPDATTNK